MVSRRVSVWIIVVLILIFVGSEASLRIAGFGSYPIYDLDDDVKYIPKSDQHGAFLNKNSWFFNDRHMGNTINWKAQLHPNILLIGNSIVLGGLPYDHKDKLGPLLEKFLDARYVVWSAAAGGWSNVNEIAYLERNTDVLQNSDVVILEYMDGGLAAPNAWPGYYVFPDQKPFLLTPYIFEKYVLPRLAGDKVSDSGTLPPVGQAEQSNLRRFTELVSAIAKTHRLLIFLYPTKKNLHYKQGWEEATAPIIDICKELSISCLDIAKENTWTDDLYKEDGVHPTVDGNKALATILASAVR
jgi:hypothetical protein